MISFVPTSVEALPGAALQGDAADVVASEGAGAFGNVLEQLMGTAGRKGAGVDLPFEDEGEPRDEADLDELANANVVGELGAQTVNRLVLAPAWTLADATATPAAGEAPVDATMVERSMSAANEMSQLFADAGMPAPTADSPAASDAASAFAALMPDAGTAADATTMPDGVNLPSAQDATEAAASTANGAAAAPLPHAASTPAAEQQPVEGRPTPEVTRDVAPKPEAERRSAGKTEKAGNGEHDRPAFRVAAEAGQRAYAAAASESTKDSSQHGMSDARSDARTAAEPASASNTAATPFQVVVERPAPSATLASAAVVSAEAIETAAAVELPAQVVQSIRMQAINGGGEAIIRLNPEYLGELVVAVKVEQGAVSAALQSDVPAVRKWVEANEGSLRQALADQGLQLDRLTVSGDAAKTETGEREGHREDSREDESQPESRRQRKKAPDATFEVVV